MTLILGRAEHRRQTVVEQRRFEAVLTAIGQALERPAGNPTGANQHRGIVDNINDSYSRPDGTSRQAALRKLRRDAGESPLTMYTVIPPVLASPASVNLLPLKAQFRLLG
jgi:hypothetical protein